MLSKRCMYIKILFENTKFLNFSKQGLKIWTNLYLAENPIHYFNAKSFKEILPIEVV